MLPDRIATHTPLLNVLVVTGYLVLNYVFLCFLID